MTSAQFQIKRPGEPHAHTRFPFYLPTRSSMYLLIAVPIAPFPDAFGCAPNLLQSNEMNDRTLANIGSMPQ